MPAFCIYEVFKKVVQERGEDKALQSVALMQQGEVIPLDMILALSAAKISVDLKLLMADSIILATARANEAVIWTQEADFEKLPEAKFIPMKKR